MGQCFSNSQNDSLSSIDWDSVSIDTLDGSTLQCKVLSVYDGDTITVGTRNPDPVIYKVRLSGLDAPEKKVSKKIEEELRLLEKEAALMVRDLCLELFKPYNLCQIKFTKEEKYGRKMGEVFIRGKSLNQYLLKEGFCKPYDGNGKEAWTRDELEELIKHCGKTLEQVKSGLSLPYLVE